MAEKLDPMALLKPKTEPRGPCCKSPVREFLAEYKRMRDSGQLVKSYRDVAAYLTEQGYPISFHQVARHVGQNHDAMFEESGG